MLALRISLWIKTMYLFRTKTLIITQKCHKLTGILWNFFDFFKNSGILESSYKRNQMNRNSFTAYSYYFRFAYFARH